MKMLNRINKDLVPMKAHYFLFNAGTGPVVPFLSTYAKQLGFSSKVVGVIYAVLPICGMIAKPVAGAIADRFRCQKLIFLASQLVIAAAFLATFYSPAVPFISNVHFACADSEAVFDTSNRNLTVDDKFVTDLQKETDKVTCTLDCAMNAQFWNTVITYWKVVEYKDSHPDRLKFITTSPTSTVDNIGNVVIFRVPEVLIEQSTYKPLCSCGAACSISTICNINSDSLRTNELTEEPSISDETVYNSYQFWVFLSLMILGWLGQAVCVSVGDAICFEMLGDKPHRYGYQRLFGALGWGIFSALTGVMVDSLSGNSAKKDFTSAFYLSAAFLIIDFLASTRINYEQRKLSTNIFKDVGRLLLDIRILVFLVWCTCIGMCTGLIWNFLFWLIEDLAAKQDDSMQNWVKTLEGLIMAVQTLLGEMPFFFLSGAILKRIGHTNAMTLVALVIGVRYILYSIIPNPWWFLPVELLNGLTFGLFYACMASYASIIAPPGTEATMQGMVGAVFEGVGVSLGSFVGGNLLDVYGPQLTFRIFGVGSLIVCLCHAFAQFLLKKVADLPDKDYEATYSSPKDALDRLDDDQQELTLVGS